MRGAVQFEFTAHSPAAMHARTAAVAACMCALTLAVRVPPAVAHDHAKEDKARALFKEAQRAYAEDRFADARDAFIEVYKLTKSADIAFNAGRICERMSDYGCAQRYLRIYLKRGKVSVHEARDIEARLKELAGAEKRQKNQLFTAPPSGDQLMNEARSFFLRGVAMFQRKQCTAAFQAFTAAQRFSPVPEVYYNLGVTAECMGARRDARDYFREYLRQRPETVDRAAVEARIKKLQLSSR